METNVEIMIETGSSRREAKGDTHGDKPRNHEGTGSTKREIKGDTHGENLEIMMKLDPVEGRQTPKYTWREAWKS